MADDTKKFDPTMDDKDDVMGEFDTLDDRDNTDMNNQNKGRKFGQTPGQKKPGNQGNRQGDTETMDDDDRMGLDDDDM